MSSDPFSDILQFTKAESLVTGGFKAGGAWAIRFPAPEKIKFFAVIKGQCMVQIEGETSPICFNQGDVGLITEKRSFILASDLSVTPLEAMELFSGAGKSTTELGDGNDFAQLGGHVLLDPMCDRMLRDVLPAWIHIPATSPHATTFNWLLKKLVEERADNLPGAQLISAQLAQMLFIQILRAHLASSSALPIGWLRALSDPRITTALELMHSKPEYNWQLHELAHACAMSRTTFALHFRTIAGTTPLAYLTDWRMRLASRALREETTPIALIGQRVGYQSESAFSTAFKRSTGQSPKACRLSALQHRQ